MLGVDLHVGHAGDELGDVGEGTTGRAARRAEGARELHQGRSVAGEASGRARVTAAQRVSVATAGFEARSSGGVGSGGV